MGKDSNYQPARSVISGLILYRQLAMENYYENDIGIPSAKQQKTIFVTIIGAPNAGKSTLLNQLIGQKIAITTHKAQTTRIPVRGVINHGNSQIIFTDTPGIFQTNKKFEQRLVDNAWDCVNSGANPSEECILLIIDCARKNHDYLQPIITQLQQRNIKALLVFNKIDLIDKEKLLPLSKYFWDLGCFSEAFMVSAKNGSGTDKIISYLANQAKASPWLFPPEQPTDISEEELYAELTREQLMINLQEELPYDLKVVPEHFERQHDGSIKIYQQIVILRNSQKAIILGENGKRLKAINIAARKSIEKQADTNIHLFLHIKVQSDWKERFSH